MKTIVLCVINFEILSAGLSGCKQPYFPSVSRSNLGFLVVDGIILNGPDTTTFNLSRTQNLTDSVYVPQPETGALVTIIGSNADTYTLQEVGNGKYIIPSLNLNYNETYQLKIVTNKGKVYISDSVPVKLTPPIDSVSRTYDTTGIHFFVSTHDPLTTTGYYRWQYVETWEYHSIYYSKLVYENGTLVTRTPAQNVYYCWSSDSSTDILVGSSANLSSDVIYEQPLLSDSMYLLLYPVNHILTLPGLSQKFSVEYSLLVNQYSITADAFAYWENLKQNTEDLGSIFSPQPSSQVSGNVHCLTNPGEPVIGYVGASTLQQKRIFINHYDLFNGATTTPQIGCSENTLMPATMYDSLRYTTVYTPIDSVINIFGVFVGLLTAPPYCTDCTANGGNNVKPPYWPN
jgi:hypothetical protein